MGTLLKRQENNIMVSKNERFILIINIEMQLHEIRVNAFNIWQDGRYRILNIDKKGQLILFKNFLEFFISIEKNLTEVSLNEALSKVRMISEELEELLCQKLVGEDKDSLPIFDYEI